MMSSLPNDPTKLKYYAAMLHIDHDDLNADQYYLLGFYRKWTGLTGEPCPFSIRSIASEIHWDDKKVRRVRAELIGKGLLTFQTVTGKATWIWVTDRRAENNERYQGWANPSPNHPYQKMVVPKSPLPESPYDPSPNHPEPIGANVGVVQAEPLKEDQEEYKNLSISSEIENAPDLPAQNYDMVSDHVDDVGEMVAPSKPEKPQLPKVPAKGIFPPSNEVKDAFAVYCYRNKQAWHTNATVMMRALNTIAKAEGRLITVDDLRGHYGWWKANDWRGKKGEMPKPYQVTETWAAYQASLDPDAPMMEADDPPDLIPIARAGMSLPIAVPRNEGR